MHPGLTAPKNACLGGPRRCVASTALRDARRCDPGADNNYPRSDFFDLTCGRWAARRATQRRGNKRRATRGRPTNLQAPLRMRAHSSLRLLAAARRRATSSSSPFSNACSAGVSSRLNTDSTMKRADRGRTMYSMRQKALRATAAAGGNPPAGCFVHCCGMLAPLQAAFSTAAAAVGWKG